MGGSQREATSLQIRATRLRGLCLVGAIIILLTALIVCTGLLLPAPSELVLANTTSQLVGTQLVVSVVVTNTSRRPVVSARNSLVEYQTTNGWQSRHFNNISVPDPLIAPPGERVSYQLYLPQETTRFRITTHFSNIGRHWVVISAVPEKLLHLVPKRLGRVLGERFVKSAQFFPVSTPEIKVEEGSTTGTIQR